MRFLTEVVSRDPNSIGITQNGITTIRGMVLNLDTSKWDVGTKLYKRDALSELTDCSQCVFIGCVVKTHNTEGAILVDVQE